MKKNDPVKLFLLFLTAVIWGTAFVAQSSGVEHMTPIAFNGARSIIGGFALLPCVAAMAIIGKKKKSRGEEIKHYDPRAQIVGGVVCGLLLFAATTSQQIALVTTSPGKVGFITALYIVLVPLFGLLFGQRHGASVWIAVALALVGLYLLCAGGSFTFNYGDLLAVICAILFALHIITVDRFSDRVNGVLLSCTQFFVCGLVSIPFMLAFEGIPDAESISAAAFPLFYAGVMSCGVAYTLQIIGQKGTDPAFASLILSLESSVAVISAWIILGDVLTVRELIGCLFLFSAIVIPPLQAKISEKKEKSGA